MTGILNCLNVIKCRPDDFAKILFHIDRNRNGFPANI